MDARRFDELARALGRRLPRRGLLASAGAAAAGAVPGLAAAQTPAAGSTVSLVCQPCDCVGDVCGCCLAGVTGGGVVRTGNGDVNFVLFATRLTDVGQQDAAGFVRWIDPHTDNGLSLESSGPISYVTDTGDPRARQILGQMTVGGASQPFVLDLLDAGPGKEGQDRVGLKVGDRAAAASATSSGFGYAADGLLVGGDLQLLGSVAPVM